MRCTETMKKAVLKIGVAMAKVDAKTSCPWINYQPCEPSAVVEMRKKKGKAENIIDWRKSV